MTKSETNARITARDHDGCDPLAVSSFEFRHSNFIRHSRFRSSNLSAFTLIELMISIALVLLLILGINQIFKYTTQAVGAGEGINSAIRNSRAIQSAFAQDFAAMVPPGTGSSDGPCLIISNQQVYAYRNAKDLAAQGDFSAATAISNATNASYPAGAPYQDLNGSGKFGDSTVNGDVTQPYQYNTRNHRVDVLSFFAHDLFRRQTGNYGSFVDNMASAEALIWYGHLQMPGTSGDSSTAHGPGQPPSAGTPATLADNPNNFFASQFTLGRVAMLMAEQSGGYIYDNAGYAQHFITRRNAYITNGGSSAYPAALDPFDYSAPDDKSAGFSNWTSRYDLAATTIASYRQQMSAFLLANPTATWWQACMDGEYVSPNSMRYYCNPFVSKPMTAAAMAQATPYFLGSCVQFTVEFAGDYVVQENNPNGDTIGGTFYPYGSRLSAGTDQEVDYQIITDGGIARKQIVWYGLPRNTSGITPIAPATHGDVMPVAWWLNQIQSFEKALPGVSSPTVGGGYTQAATSMQNGDRYICAWGPNDKATRPKLIRITLTLDDPSGNLPDGQTYQYVFAVP
jgi:hypothetical protein